MRERQSAAYNAADLAFATEMIAHHRQAIAMAEDILDANGCATLRSPNVAEEIRIADASEIEVMTAWLESWDAGATRERGWAIPGRGNAASERIIQRMIDHQADAIRLCRHELNEGKNSVALKLAQRIIDARTKQIEKLEGLLAR